MDRIQSRKDVDGGYKLKDGKNFLSFFASFLFFYFSWWAKDTLRLEL